jgi:site-specific DNA-methyltransferase (adenine-specific)
LRFVEKNQLYYGDNLAVLREHIRDESVDLIYLDPPFNSRQDYNVLFAERDGTRSASQIMAFEDTWEWNMDAERAYEEIVERGGRVSDAVRAFRTFLGHSDMMAYLAMMAPRLIELHRVLKETGSIYLHCDPTASHYLKMLMDAVFGAVSFRNEVIWKRTSAHGNASRSFAAVHDTILMYVKSTDPIWNQSFAPYTREYIEEHFVHKDPDGRLFRRVDLRNPSRRPNLTYDYLASNGRLYKPHANGWAVSSEVMRKLDSEKRLFFPAKAGGRLRRKIYLDESPGVPIPDLWNDLPPIHASSAERLGYPTQKPEALLERIIKASSNEGDWVLDPFCGCGTAIAAAQHLNRRWIGIDITHLAIGLIKTRLADAFGDGVRETYEVIGEPVDLAGAEKLAEEDKYQFQWWALSQVGARPLEKKKGADQGIDGRLYFHDEAKGGTTKQIIFSVKGGHLAATHVRDLRGVIEREKAEIGVLISMEPPTKPMLKEAAEAGLYQPPGTSDKFPRLQILHIAELLEGKKIDYPRYSSDATFKKAPKSRKAAEEQIPLATGEIEEPF